MILRKKHKGKLCQYKARYSESESSVIVQSGRTYNADYRTVEQQNRLFDSGTIFPRNLSPFHKVTKHSKSRGVDKFNGTSQKHPNSKTRFSISCYKFRLL